jgi:hypothetical protein
MCGMAPWVLTLAACATHRHPPPPLAQPPAAVSATPACDVNMRQGAAVHAGQLVWESTVQLWPPLRARLQPCFTTTWPTPQVRVPQQHAVPATRCQTAADSHGPQAMVSATSVTCVVLGKACDLMLAFSWQRPSIPGTNMAHSHPCVMYAGKDAACMRYVAHALPKWHSPSLLTPSLGSGHCSWAPTAPPPLVPLNCHTCTCAQLGGAWRFTHSSQVLGLLVCSKKDWVSCVVAAQAACAC